MSEKDPCVGQTNGARAGTLEMADPSKDGSQDPDKEEVILDTEPRLFYKINEVPPAGVILSVAMQNVLLGLGGSLTTAYFISDVICAPPTHPVRAVLFCTTCFMTGLCTFLQSIVGVRLPIYQSVCSTFLVPLMAMRSDNRWNCKLQDEWFSGVNETANVTVQDLGEREARLEYEMYHKLREMMGCLLLASLLEVIVGATGLVGVVLRFIGPLSVAVVVSLIGLSLYKIPMEYGQTHWGLTVLCVIVTIVSMLYMNRVKIPLPVVTRRRFKQQFKLVHSPTKLPVFQMFPLLFGIIITWAICAIMTKAGYFTDDPGSNSYRARTDVRNDVIRLTPWLYVPYPGQFGSPLFNVTIFVGFLSTVVSSIFETIGDYFCAASLTGVPPPPKSAVNRGVLLEGLGSVLSGAVGAGHATTSSTGNLVLIGISKVASRSCLVATGVILMILSVIGKLGAFLSTMPDPVVGGSMFVTFGIIAALGIFTLNSVDLSSSRNLAVFGMSLYSGIVIPEWLSRNPDGFDAGSDVANGVIKGILGTPMFLGGLVAIILDNTVKGTKKERGLHTRDPDFYFEDGNDVSVSGKDVYELPGVNRLAKVFPWIRLLPFIQKEYDADTNLQRKPCV